MPLPDGYIGSGFSWPMKISAKDQYGIPRTDRGELFFTPSMLVKASFVDAAAKVTNGISVSHTGAAAAGTTSQTIGGSLTTAGVATLSPARNVVITVTHATSIVAMSGVITGTDQYGTVITEAWTISATGTSKTNTGLKAFKTVTAITEVVAADASANSIISGSGDVLGLPFQTAQILASRELQDGATPTAGVLVAGVSGSATRDARGTYAPNAAPDGAKDFLVWFIVDDPTVIT